MIKSMFATLFVFGLLGGCGGTSLLEVRRDSFHYPRYGYRVKFAKPPSRWVVSNAWLIDNMHADESGKIVLNKGKQYYGYALIDRDGDGKYEKERAYFFDLKLKHRTSGAVIWVQTHELSHKSTDLSLDRLLASYVSSLTGTGFYAEANVFSISVVKQKRFAAVIRQRAKGSLGRHRTLSARVQIVNLDQRKVEPNHPGDSVHVTLLKIPYKYERPYDGGTVPIRGYAVMIIGYYNTTPAFDTLFAAYKKLLSSIVFAPVSRP